MEYGCDFIRQVTKIDSISDAYRGDVINETIERLEAIKIVGILEKIGPFIVDFERHFNVRLSIRHANKSPAKKSTKAAVSPKLRRQIEELCEPNRRIYEHFSRRL